MSNKVVVSLDVETNGLAFIKLDDYYLKLFTNAYVPVRGMAPANFTEAAGGGYAHVVVDSSADFTEEYGNAPPDIILPEQSIAFSGPLTGDAEVKGWYLIKQDLSKVRAAKLLDTPYTPPSGGGTLRFTPRIQAGGGTPT